MTARARAGLVAVPAVAVMVWLAGFAWFVQSVGTQPGPAPRADGIVVLTGGAARVDTALHLLAGGRARILLVSGVGGPTEFAELARRAGIDPGLGARVTLGRAAASTHGNALETADWARANGVRSLLVVTAGYHMPRAMAELGRALPDVALHPVPVLPSRPGLRLLAGEYTKFLATEAGLSGLSHAAIPSADALAHAADGGTGIAATVGQAGWGHGG